MSVIASSTVSITPSATWARSCSSVIEVSGLASVAATNVKV